MKKKKKNKELVINLIIITIIIAISIIPIKNEIKDRINKNQNNNQNNTTRFGYDEIIHPEQGCNCIAVVDPVCGKNHQTYGNSCQALCDGQTEYTEGECKTNIFKKILNKLNN